MDDVTELIVVLLTIGLSLMMVVAAVGKILRLSPMNVWPNSAPRDMNLMIVPELFAIVFELGLVWLLWTSPSNGLAGSSVLFSAFNLYLAWLVSRGVKRCNCFGTSAGITQNKLAVNQGVSILAAVGSLIAGPPGRLFQCAIGLVLFGGFAAFVWSSRYVAQRQALDSLREPPAVGIDLREFELAPRCMIVFVTPQCSGCDFVLDRVAKLDAVPYPRYGVIDATTPESLRSSASSKIVQSGLALIEDPLGTMLQEHLSVRVFPSVVAVDDWVSIAAGVSVDGLTAAHESLAVLS